MKRVLSADERVFQWVASHRSTQANMPLAKGFRLISKTADGHLYPVILLAMFLLDNTYGYLLFYTALMAYALEVPLYIFLKKLIKRPRPCDLLFNFETFVVPADKFSLPSGHTAAAFLMASLVSYFYPHVAFIMFFWASLVAISRVILRVHYPMDVVIGAVLGVVVSVLSVYVLH